MKIELTPNQERDIRNYFRIQDAKSVLDCYEIHYDNISDNELIDIAIKLENAIYDNIGDIEIAVLENMGYL